jgi:hypothetical protein
MADVCVARFPCAIGQITILAAAKRGRRNKRKSAIVMIASHFWNRTIWASYATFAADLTTLLYGESWYRLFVQVLSELKYTIYTGVQQPESELIGLRREHQDHIR